jgi:hypothetical protein
MTQAGVTDDGSAGRRANDNDIGCSVLSAERIGDPDAAIVLAVVDVFGQDLHAAHRAGTAPTCR